MEGLVGKRDEAMEQHKRVAASGQSEGLGASVKERLSFVHPHIMLLIEIVPSWATMLDQVKFARHL